MTPEQYVKIRNEISNKISKLYLDISEARNKAKECKMPEHLRPATPDDIVIDNVIWYPRETGGYWAIVDEVIHPDDRFKAYVYNGCRMGLDGAYVEQVDIAFV